MPGSKIKRDDLIVSVTDKDGNIKEYKADLTKLQLDEPSLEKVKLNLRSIRDLSRSEYNLHKALDLISLLENLIRTQGRQAGFDVISQALFCHSIALYGACFMKGGIDRKIPLVAFEKEMEGHSVHNEVMTMRHKLFGHLDEDHEVRADQVLWQLQVTEPGTLKPYTAAMRGDRIALRSLTFLLAWVEVIEELLGRVGVMKQGIVTDTNKLVGEIEVVGID